MRAKHSGFVLAGIPLWARDDWRCSVPVFLYESEHLSQSVSTCCTLCVSVFTLCNLCYSSLLLLLVNICLSYVCKYVCIYIVFRICYYMCLNFSVFLICGQVCLSMS